MTQDIDFNDRFVLIVGGSSGIGNAAAQAFRSRGAKVCVWGTRTHREDYNGEDGSDLSGLDYVCVNVGDPEAISNAPIPFPVLDILVLCQGVVAYERAEYQRAAWDNAMAINLGSLMSCSLKFKPLLGDRKGSIIIMSSVAGLGSSPNHPAYAASKAGAISLTKSLGSAWASEGIRVNGIAPGLVATKINVEHTANPETRKAWLDRIPAGRMGDRSEIAGAVLFLASPLASYINGHTLVVDGGLTL